MKFLFLIVISVFLSSCSTTTTHSQRTSPEDSPQKTMETMKTLAESMAGQELTEEDLKRLERDMREDKDVQQTVQEMTDLIKGEKEVVKYCPEDGKRYSPRFQYCPGTNIPLKILEE